MAAGLNSTSADLGNVHRPDTDESTEQFLMYGYKVVPCSKRYRHDWSVCPFSHTGEMAARRDPSRYLPIFCYHSKQRLPCPRGEECPYSHNLFEYWLHPQRYRTEMCQFGASCTRPVCFFAHGEHQLRQTGMPGGPQPVVAPPEPNPALAAAGFPGTVTDPAVKQQQQLLALQAAAAGFSSHQMRSDSLLPVVDQLSSGSGSAAVYNSLMNGGGSMDMSALHRELSGVGAGNFTAPLPSSAPLSAPLPQLTPDLLAALQNMSAGNAGGQAGGPGSGSGMSPLGGRLIHHGSGIPASYSSGLPPPRPLARSMTVGAQPPPPLHHQSSEAAGQGLDELTKQLAMMQLMQANGATSNASAQLPHVGSQGMTADFLGALAQLHQEQQQQQQQQHAVAGSAAMDLEAFLGTPASAAMLQSPDGSFSCPLPPLYGSNPQLNSLLSPNSHAAAAASAGIQRVPSANAAQLLAAQQQLQMQLGSLVVNAPTSPAPSEGGKDAPSPSSRARRDTSSGLHSGSNAIVGAGNSQDSRVAAPGKKAQPWSAPVSPCTSSRGGNDLTAAAHDVKLSSISFTAGGSRDAGSSGTSSPSNSGAAHANGNGAAAAQMVDAVLPEEAVNAPSFGQDLPRFTAGFSDANGSSADGQQHQDGDATPLLMIGDQAFSHLGQLQQEIAGDAAVSKQQQQQQQVASSQQQQQGMGQEMAVKLLAQLPEESVRKLLDLVAKQG